MTAADHDHSAKQCHFLGCFKEPDAGLLRIQTTYSGHMTSGCLTSLSLSATLTDRRIESEETRKLLITTGFLLSMKHEIIFLSFC